MPALAYKSAASDGFQIVSLRRNIVIESGFENKAEAVKRYEIIVAMPFYANGNVVIRQWTGREFRIINAEQDTKDKITDAQYAAARRKARALTFRNLKLRPHMEQAIALQAKAEPSDPHVEDRVRAYFREGIAEVADFNVRFRKEERVASNGNKYHVDVPYGQVRM